MTWVAVGVGAVTAVGSYAASEKNNKGSATSESPEVRAAQESALDMGKTISQRAYTPYTGERVAGLSANEKQASELAKYGSSESKDYYDQAASTIDGIQTFDQADFDAYMNPYTEAVLTPQLREQNEAYDKSRSQLLNSKAGAFGGDRAAFAASELEANHMEALSDITSTTYAAAFDYAVQSWSQDQDRKLNVATALRAVGNDVSQLNQQQIQDLMLTGGTQRLLEQAELDFDYQQFIEERDWDVTNLQPLIQAISASKGGSVTTSSTSSTGAIGQALGAAATVLGAYYGSGGSQSSNDELQYVGLSSQPYGDDYYG